MKELKYVDGDVREPVGDGFKVICHICNDQNTMGSGVARSLYEKWNKVKSRYHKHCTFFHERKANVLGSVNLVEVTPTIYVANMIAQHMVGVDENGNPPIRYDALIECLRIVREFVFLNKDTIHIPYKMGADRAGGDWDIIEKIIKNELCSKDIDVTIYKWKG